MSRFGGVVIVSQQDIRRLSDAEVKRLVLRMHEAAGGVEYPPMREFWRSLEAALVGALRERASAWAWAEFDFGSGDAEMGGLVGPDDDPIAEGLEELRRAVRDEGDVDG